MKCPECGSGSEVLNVRNYGVLVWRRHRCLKCKSKFTSEQRLRRKDENEKKVLPVSAHSASIQKRLDTH